MEASMPYLLSLLLVPLSLYLYLYLFTRKKGSGDLPPGSDGWPILGENLQLAVSGVQQLVRERMRKYSPVIFRTSLLGERMVVLCGAEGNKFVFTNEDKLFRRWPPASTRKVMFPDPDQSRRQHRDPVLITFHNFQYDALKPESLKQYVGILDASTRHHLLREWNPSTVVRALPSTMRYTLDLVCRVFMNVADKERVAATLLEPFSHMIKGTMSVPVDFPGTAFNRALRGGRVVRRELRRIVEERRKELIMTSPPPENKNDDLLSKMVRATVEDGNIVNVIVGLLINAHYEVSCALTVVLSFLAQLPHIYHKVLQEQMEIAKSKGPDELLTWEDVEKMNYTWNVVRETFRLVPPGGAFREAITDFKYAGFTIPKGWKIYWTGHATHENPEYFPEPEKFDPSRFEGSGPAPYTYIPFGGGPKMCPGRVYTRLVILVFIHNLVTRFNFDKAIPNEKMLFDLVSAAPAHGLPLHLHPHQN